LVDGEYQGKLVFMCRSPEKVFDIGWRYDPNVVITPVMEKWIFNENPGYDVWTLEMLEKVMDQQYVVLTKDEIDEIVQATI